LTFILELVRQGVNGGLKKKGVYGGGIRKPQKKGEPKVFYLLEGLLETGDQMVGSFRDTPKKKQQKKPQRHKKKKKHPQNPKPKTKNPHTKNKNTPKKTRALKI